MTHQIERARVSDERAFAEAVASHVEQMTAWQAQTDKVARVHAEADALKAAGKDESAELLRASVGLYPAPQAHPEVAASVLLQGDKFVADYEIVGRRKCNPRTQAGLDAHKEGLRHEVRQMEQVDLSGIMPAGKWRLANIQAEDARAVPEENRTQEQKDAVSASAARGQRMREIQRHYAEQEAQIDDLTLGTVDAWEPRTMPL